jgi:hypothetical protein
MDVRMTAGYISPSVKSELTRQGGTATFTARLVSNPRNLWDISMRSVTKAATHGSVFIKAENVYRDSSSERSCQLLRIRLEICCLVHREQWAWLVRTARTFKLYQCIVVRKRQARTK